MLLVVLVKKIYYLIILNNFINKLYKKICTLRSHTLFVREIERVNLNFNYYFDIYKKNYYCCQKMFSSKFLDLSKTNKFYL